MRGLAAGAFVVASATAIAATLAACGPATPKETAKVEPAAPAPCLALCDDEARCGDVAPECRATCAREAAILEASVPERVAACRHATLETACFGKSSAFTHGDLLADGRCFDLAAAPLLHDEANRRRFADASCARMLRCQVSGPPPAPEVRKECVELTLHPPDGGEPAEREAMRVLDALRPEVVARLESCLNDAPCPSAGQSDPAGDACLLAALGRDAP